MRFSRFPVRIMSYGYPPHGAKGYFSTVAGISLLGEKITYLNDRCLLLENMRIFALTCRCNPEPRAPLKIC